MIKKIMKLLAKLYDQTIGEWDRALEEAIDGGAVKIGQKGGQENMISSGTLILILICVICIVSDINRHNK